MKTLKQLQMKKGTSVNQKGGIRMMEIQRSIIERWHISGI